MNIMFTWLGDLCEDASDKLEDIEGLSVGMVEQAPGDSSFLALPW